MLQASLPRVAPSHARAAATSRCAAAASTALPAEMNERLDACARLARKRRPRPRAAPCAAAPPGAAPPRDRARRCAGGTRLAELDFELAVRPAKAASIRPSSAMRRRVGDHRHHVVEFHPRLAAREQRELAQLMTGRQAVAAEQRNKRGAGLRRNRKPASRISSSMRRTRSRSASA